MPFPSVSKRSGYVGASRLLDRPIVPRPGCCWATADAIAIEAPEKPTGDAGKAPRPPVVQYAVDVSG